MDRLFGTLDLRSTDDERREFSGIANTAAEDSYGTVIVPAGARLTLPLPLLWQHDQKTPVGEITHAELRDGKWHVRGSIRKVTEPGIVKDATDAAWHNVKYKLVRGLSIGFNELKRTGNRIAEWMWRELSLVTIPSNSEATILTVRSAYLAASGGTHRSPGVSGNSNTSPNPRPNMTTAEQITQHENSRAAKVARQVALMERSGAEGSTLGETEAEEYDTLTREVEAIDGHLARLNSLKAATETRAVAVVASSSATASQSRSGVPVVSVKANVEPGINFARHAMSLAVSNGNKYEAAEYAKRTWGDAADEIVGGLRNGLNTRAAVAPGTTVQATFAAPLVVTNYVNDFLDLLRPKTILGRIPGLRHVPFNVSMPAQTAGGTYKWVGQGKLKPVTNAQYASVTLTYAKASGIIVLTEELVRQSTPSAEAAVRDEMVKGVMQFLDTQLVDSTVAAVATVNPASITNGVTGTAASAATGAAARADISARVAALAALGYPVNELVILMSESIAFSLGLALNAVGGELFPGLTASGGSILGIPVVTSQSVGAQVIVAHAPSILMADEGGVEIDISREASLSLDSAPTDPADATAVYTSLWQANLVALRVERWITWGKARSTAVDRITSAAYTGA
jgi:HK97 family phage major capsid protein/HK97 family phage prohead protease